MSSSSLQKRATESQNGGTACTNACVSAASSCATTSLLVVPTRRPPQSAPTDDQHVPSAISSQSDLGPLTLAETFQATFVRIMQLGVWRGLLGSLAVFWILISATIGCILSIGLWLRRKENDLQERDRRWELAEAREAGLRERRRRRRRVRWLDEVEGGQELELEKMVVEERCEILKMDDDSNNDGGLVVKRGDGERVCEECLVAKID